MTQGTIDVQPGVVAVVPSKSEGYTGKVHEVRLSKNGIIYCDCDGFRWRGHCSHIDTMIEQNPGAKLLVKASLREKIAHFEKIIAVLDK